jgi:hypothetical protein
MLPISDKVLKELRNNLFRLDSVVYCVQKWIPIFLTIELVREKEVIKMETRLKMRLMEEIASKRLSKLVSIVETIYQKIAGRYDEAKEASVAASMPSPYAYLLSIQRMHEIETQKALIIKISRHETCKAGGPN